MVFKRLSLPINAKNKLCFQAETGSAPFPEEPFPKRWTRADAAKAARKQNVQPLCGVRCYPEASVLLHS